VKTAKYVLSALGLVAVAFPNLCFAETWQTKGLCHFNGLSQQCTVKATADLAYPAWSATYQLTWADGVRQKIVVGSDVRATVWVMGKATQAEQLPPDANGFCVIRTVTGNVTRFNSGRQNVTSDHQSGC